jgi:hypothetical protein
MRELSRPRLAALEEILNQWRGPGIVAQELLQRLRKFVELHEQQFSTADSRVSWLPDKEETCRLIEDVMVPRCH